MGHECKKFVEYELGISNIGNISRIVKVIKRAERGEDITIAFIGGSITMGSLSSSPKTCYAYNVYKWMKKEFPLSNINYINAGIGATDSQFGCARVETDVLKYNPDIVFIEFSVNDEATEHYRETYEGLVRRVYYDSSYPAVMIIHNVRYDDGTNAEDIHGEIAEYYDIPSVSMKSCLYRYIEEGSIKKEDITPDNLHPNDKGHEIVANTICYALGFIEHGGKMVDENSKVFCESLNTSYAIKSAITKNAFEHSIRYQNDSDIYCLNGFRVDLQPQKNITDIFKKGFIGSKVGDKITFKVKASNLAVQYRKSIKHPAPIAKLIVDDKEEYILDANFDESWGDKLAIDTVLVNGDNTYHTVDIELISEGDVEFYFASVIASV